MPHVQIQKDHFTVLVMLVTQEMAHFVQVNIHIFMFLYYVCNHSLHIRYFTLLSLVSITLITLCNSTDMNECSHKSHDLVIVMPPVLLRNGFLISSKHILTTALNMLIA